MAFRYSLQPLLRLRASLEHQEEQRLLAIAAVVARLRAEIEQLRQNGLEAKRAGLAEIERTSSGASVQFAAVCGAAFDKACKKLESRLEDAERDRLHQLREYQAVRQKREILEGLRERQETAYELEFTRHEQQAADEAFLVRAHLISSE